MDHTPPRGVPSPTPAGTDDDAAPPSSRDDADRAPSRLTLGSSASFVVMYGLSQLPQLEEWQSHLTTGLNVAAFLVGLQLVREVSSRVGHWASRQCQVSATVNIRWGRAAGANATGQTDTAPIATERAPASVRSPGP